MLRAVALGVFVGAVSGFLLSRLRRSFSSHYAGGSSNDGVLYGALIGGLIGGFLGSGGTSYTPSPHLLSVGSLEAFETEVLATDEPALIEFYTPACGYCVRLEPVMHSLADRFAGRSLVGKVNVKDLREIGERYQIRGVPTLIVFRDGEEVDRTVGYQPEENLAALIERHLQSPPQEENPPDS